MPKKTRKPSIFKWLGLFFTVSLVILAGTGYLIYERLAADLPDVKTLHNVQYEIPLSVYSKDNQLIGEFGGNKRIPIKIQNVPKQLIHAFLAAEDNNFFEHPGVDYKGLLRAALQLASTGKKKQGGSTITMQVTRNFLLSSEKTFTRKLKEIILALQIEREYTKEQILELYLNQIYMGHSAYGVVAAAQTYYGKKLNQLTLAEQAMIAGLPKAPSSFNPLTNVERAIERRNYVLQRMAELNYISREELDSASKQPSTAKLQYRSSELSAPFVAEMVRQYMVDQYNDRAYTMGLRVYTTVDPVLQKAAEQSLRDALHTYDNRHGFRLPKKDPEANPGPEISAPVIGDTLLAKVTHVNDQGAKAELFNGNAIQIPWGKMDWAGPKLRKYLQPGVSIRVRPSKNNTWALTQVPEVEGAFVSLNPANGAILSLVGGFEFSKNKFNRATQAKRQPGSGFKPIIYTTALEQGYTAASLINDAPISVYDPSMGRNWKPENASRKFYGPTTLRKALTFSRNIVAVQLLKDVGIAKGVATGKRFGFSEEQMPWGLSLALGSGYASPLQMARMYAVFANGGFLVDPYFIERIETYEGKTIYQASPKTACATCKDQESTTLNLAPQIISPGINFIMNSLMRDVVKLGTATDARVLGRSDIAGKTGTTNDQRDAWFNGFTPTHVASAWVGFDNYKPLGHYETGGVAALPMWIEYMRTALKKAPVVKFVPPNDVSQQKINGVTEYVQKGVVLKKQAPMPKKMKTENPAAAKAKQLIKEKPIESLF